MNMVSPAETSVSLPNGTVMPLLGLGTTHSGGYDHDAVVYALTECNYRMIDTAKRYGVESQLGTAISASGIARDELFLTTKLWPVDYGYLSTQEECKKSCRRLNTDYVDLYLLHFPEVPSWFDRPQSLVLEETWRAMEKLYENDVCRAIGVSNYSVDDLEKVLDYCSVSPHVNQYEFHPYYNPKKLREFCKAESILYAGYCPLAKGTILKEQPILSLSKKYDRTPAQICIRWSLQQGVPAIPKSLKLNRLLENSRVMDFTLDRKDMDLLDSLHDPTRKQVALDNLQEKFALPAGYKLKIPSKSNAPNMLLNSSPTYSRMANVMG